MPQALARCYGLPGACSGASTMPRTRAKKSYVVCLSNDGYAASLESRKIYLALRDAAAERNGLLRVVDESGEDYLYSRERFAPRSGVDGGKGSRLTGRL
jgi:hypothetical protein